jgi:hypothetical protein
MTVHNGHTDWCARGHLCGLGEHRAEPIAITVPKVGTSVLTRVRDTYGRQYAEIRLVIRLPAEEPKARLRLITLLTGLPALMNARPTRHEKSA